MVAHKFNYEEHAVMVGKWLTKHSFPLPPKDLLPDIGFLVDDAACGFLYTTNSKLGWVEWVFSNPEKPKEDRAAALDVVFKLLENVANQVGITALFSAASIPGYAAVLERNNFKSTDKNITHYIKLLGVN